MTQPFPRFCPQCGSPRETGQHFCPACGMSLDVAANTSTARASDGQSTLVSPSTPNEAPFASGVLAAPGSGAGAPKRGLVIPQASLLAGSPTPVFDTSGPTASAGAGDQFFVSYGDVPGIPPPPPPASLFASPSSTPAAPGISNVPSDSRASRRSRAALFAVVLLLILLLGGVGGYVVFFHSNGQNSNQQGTNTGGHQSTPGSGRTEGSGTSTASGSTVESLHLQFTYASEVITITSVQEAANFADDPQPFQGQGLVRIVLNEKNATRYHAGFQLFGDVAHLLLPDGSTANVNAARSDGSLDANTSRPNNWLDFAVSAAVPDLSKLVLRMGTPTEHQMDIPLMPNADLSQYQDKTITPNTPVNYGGLNWTLQSVTLSLSGVSGGAGPQAPAGMRYVILSLRVDNPTSRDVVIGFVQDYLRLQSTDATNAPLVDTTTLPGHAPANTTNITGTVFFLMPENDTSFTLQWLVSKNPVYDPVSDTQVNTPIQFQ